MALLPELWLTLSGDTGKTEEEVITKGGKPKQQSPKTKTQVLIGKPLRHLHLASFSCRTHRASDRGE